MKSIDPFFILFSLFSNEQNCLEILPYGFDIISFFKELIHFQRKNFNNLVLQKKSNNLSNFVKNLETERIIFILKSYHRLRIWKIEKYLLRTKKCFKIKNLSKGEKKYCQIYEFFFLKKIGQLFYGFFNYTHQRSLNLKSIFLKEEIWLKKNYFVFFKVLKKKNFFQKNILFVTNPNTFYGNDIYCMRFISVKILILSRVIYLI